MTKAAVHLVFIPAPAVGHLVSTFEIAKLLLARDQRLSITMLLVQVPFDIPKINSYAETLSFVPRGLSFVPLPLDQPSSARLLSSPSNLLAKLIQIHTPRVKDIISSIITTPMVGPALDSTRVVSVVVDMFCTSFVDVARELGLPSYVFLTSGAAFLGLVLHLQSLHDADPNPDVISDLVDSGAELDVSCFSNRVPSKTLPPDVLTNKSGTTSLLTVPRWFRQSDGILVNTFSELEPHAVDALSEDKKIPRVYPVGPLLNLDEKTDTNEAEEIVIKWLDDRPFSSVVYLCFGSRCAFEKDQTREIAIALERSGRPFVWSLQNADGTDGSDDSSFLPDGFLGRTEGVGIVIGWAPQVAILSHRAVGGFVSHCGWNSTLESVWFGVPIGAWPRQAEQHVNAFELVRELGLAVEIKIDNSRNNALVTCEEIESGIRRLMDPIESEGIRENVKRVKEGSRGALLEGGSSYSALGNFIDDLIAKSTENVSP